MVRSGPTGEREHDGSPSARSSPRERLRSRSPAPTAPRRGSTTNQLALAAVVDILGAITTLLGRGLQGTAAGLASSAIAAFVVDTGTRAARSVAPTITGAGATIGLAGGALGSGALVDLAPLPRILPFVGALALLVIAAILVVRVPETVERRPGVLASLRPQLRLPRSARRPLVAAGTVLVATWALGGYHQAFGPTITRDDLQSSSTSVAAAVFSSSPALAVAGGPLAQRLSPRRAQLVGISVIVVSIGGLVPALDAHSVAAFLVRGAIAGIAQGVASEGSMRSLLPHASAGERAGPLACRLRHLLRGCSLDELHLRTALCRAADAYDHAGYCALALVALLIVIVRREDARS